MRTYRRHPTLAAVCVTQLREHEGRLMIPCAFTSTMRERTENTIRRSIELSKKRMRKDRLGFEANERVG